MHAVSHTLSPRRCTSPEGRRAKWALYREQYIVRSQFIMLPFLLRTIMPSQCFSLWRYGSARTVSRFGGKVRGRSQLSACAINGALHDPVLVVVSPHGSSHSSCITDSAMIKVPLTRKSYYFARPPAECTDVDHRTTTDSDLSRKHPHQLYG